LPFRLAERVGEAMFGHAGRRGAKPSPSDDRRISIVLRYIEQNADGAIDPRSALRPMAAMSKYHFLRVFRRATGFDAVQTSCLGVRMRRARREVAPRRPYPVSQIAYERGDLAICRRSTTGSADFFGRDARADLPLRLIRTLVNNGRLTGVIGDILR